MLIRDRPAIVNATAPMNNVAISNEIFGPDVPSPTGYVDAAGNPISLANARYQVRFDFFNVLNQPNYLLTFDRGDVTNTLFNDAKSQPEDLVGQGGSARSGRIQLRLTF